MFGMGFTEILIIAVIAILFLGPDKLPSAMIDIAKFFRNVKNTIGTVKDSLEEEMNVSEIKKEALAYKAELAKATATIDQMTDIKGTIGSQVDSFTESLLDESDEPAVAKASTQPEEVTFKKKKKKITTEEETTNV